MARLLHGRPLAERIKAETRARVEALVARSVHTQLAVVSVGPDPAALTYTERLTRSGHASGIAIKTASLPRETTEAELVRTLEELGRDGSVHGIILMTPLPGKLDEGHIVDHIAVAKDVEGMHPFSVGWLADGRPRFVPSTAEAVVELLRFYEIPIVTPQGIAGDVDAESVGAVAGALSPVPGGLGAVTTALLLRNVVTAAESTLQH